MMLSAEEEHDIVTRAQAGDRRARERLVLAFRPMVEKEVRAIMRQSPRIAEDATQEAFAGLVRAIDKFDTSRGLRFSTYARPWVRAALFEFMLRDALIKAPSTSDAKRAFFGLGRAMAAARQANPAGTEEEHLTAACAALAVPVELARSMSAARSVTSLDVRSDDGDDRSATIVETVADPNDHFERRAEEEEEARLEVLRAAMADLSPRHREVLEARLAGLTLHDIAHCLDLSRERIRQLAERAIKIVSADARALAGIGGDEVMLSDLRIAGRAM